MSRKEKLLQRLLSRPTDLEWGEVCTLMRKCGFELHNRGGSRRMFRHVDTRQKVTLHEPHGGDPYLKPYAIEYLIDALRDAGEIE